jgi:hypothetical protein
MLFADDVLEGIALEIVKSVYIADVVWTAPVSVFHFSFSLSIIFI